MNKIQLFSEKATYASPSSKLIILQGSQSLLSNSDDVDLWFNGGTGAGSGSYSEDDDE